MATAPLFLPIDIDLAQSISRDGFPSFDAAQPWAAAFLAAVATIQQLPQMESVAPDELEIGLARCIALANAVTREHGAHAFAQQMAARFDLAAFRRGMALLESRGIRLLDEEQVAARAYLSSSGEWDFDFRKRHARAISPRQYEGAGRDGAATLLTEPQYRISGQVRADPDEHLHVQGYAGTGKTFLLRELVGLLSTAAPHSRIVVLAKTPPQVRALRARLPPHILVRSFDELTREILPDPDMRRRDRVAQVGAAHTERPLAEIAAYFGMHAIGRLSIREVVQATSQALRNFCNSADAAPGPQHLPAWARAAGDIPLSAKLQMELLQFTHYAWHALWSAESRGFRRRMIHRLKKIDLDGLQIPGRYTHVILDESHDLNRPMLRVLERSPQTLITFGDEYQHLRGEPVRRNGTLLQNRVTLSVRAGHALEAVINPIIETHPTKPKEPFQGNGEVPTELKFYRDPHLPQPPATLLAGDTWGLFDWTLRLAEEGATAHALCDLRSLKRFGDDCIELYGGRGPVQHAELLGLENWDAAAKRFNGSRGFHAVRRRLERGLRLSDWERALSCFVPGPASYQLGTIEDGRNHEFPCVMLSPEVLDKVYDPNTGATLDYGSEIYLGATRAQIELLIPEGLRDWLEEISGRRSGTR